MITFACTSTGRRIAGALALAAGLAGAGSCVSEHSTGTVSVNDCTTPAAAAGLPVIFIKRFTYVPAQLHISAGQSVAWVNCEPDGTPHTATADAASFNSGLLNPGDAYVRQFPTAATIPYHCDLHPSMKATVIVD